MLVEEIGIEAGGGVGSTESLVLSRGLEFAIEAGITGEELRLRIRVIADIEWEGQRVITDVPGAQRATIAERRGAHRVGASWKEIHIRCRAEGIPMIVARITGTGAAADLARGDSLVAFEDDAQRMDLSREVTLGKCTITSSERQAEEVTTSLDLAGERNYKPGLRRAIEGIDLQGVRSHLGVAKQVRQDERFQHLAPLVIVFLTIRDPEEFATEREGSAVLIRVVEAEAAFYDVPVPFQFREEAR